MAETLGLLTKVPGRGGVALLLRSYPSSIFYQH